MNKFIVLSLTIFLLMFQANASVLNITFSEIGFDIELSGAGSVYREALITYLSDSGVVLVWHIELIREGKGGAELSFGANFTKVNIELNSSKVEEKIQINGSTRRLLVWLNLTSNGSKVAIKPNSSIELIPLKEPSSNEVYLLVAYIALYTTPLALLAIRRIRDSEEKDRRYIVYGEEELVEDEE